MIRLFLPKEPSHRDRGALPDLIQEDMSVMSDFELMALCKQYKVSSLMGLGYILYRVFRYFRTPPPQLIWALVSMKTVCFQDPISIPNYRASFQN